MVNNLLLMGKYRIEYNAILGINLESQNIYRSRGLPTHMIKRNHFKCIKYIDSIPDIVSNPDYIGINKKNNGEYSIDFVKKLKINVLVAVRLDNKSNYLYIATVHDIQESKLLRRLHSGRLKKLTEV